MAVQIFAHRGYSGRAMENSLTAFRMAKEAKVDGVELDVHLTLDREVVVIHDERLDRTTTGTGWIGQLSYDQISQHSLLTLPNETVPKLSDVLELFFDTSIVVNIELKNQYIRYPQLAEEVVNLVEYYGMQQRVIVSSFYHPCLIELKKYRPSWNIAFLLDCALYEPWKYAKSLDIHQLHLHYTAIDQQLYSACKNNGVVIRAYTVNEEKEMFRLASIGIEAMITNYPGRLRRVIDHIDMEC
ncbi:glycerophosphodiester phosphodiesterase [Shimazuella sp. AN120528]|uniref:glycerophosphodiester phosphodiesterase n=1 Tax=Shimazuella soli TaxID=1892854 RepID=UPI001F118E0D|nr:glycerophosphodiester phosphodiesterase [Shimazuella soli]MCH5584010.1 glycerophosphodiester phosphodiesterase [Shimazuella soli]